MSNENKIGQNSSLPYDIKMKKEKPGQEPAYPIFLQEGLSHNSHVDCGISQRLLLAGMALQGLLANRDV